MTFITTKRHIRLAGMAAALLAMLVQPASANQFKRINDVNVSCSNSLQCDLFITDTRITLYSFALRRGAADQAEMSLVLTTRQPLAAGSDVALRVDGQDIARFNQSALSYRAAVYEYVLRDSAIVEALLAAASNGRVLQVEYATRSGQTAASFGLSGFTEGLRFADAVQGRQGAENAWSRFTGQTSAAPDIGIMPIARFDDVPFLIRSRFYRRSDSLCGGADTQGAGFNGAFSLSAGEVALYALPCGPSSQSDRAFSLFELAAGELSVLPFPVVTAAGPTVLYRVPNLAWDTDARLLSAQTAGEACEQTHQWAVGGSAPLRLTLTTSVVTDGCDDAVQPWPATQ